MDLSSEASTEDPMFLCPTIETYARHPWLLQQTDVGWGSSCPLWLRFPSYLLGCPQSSCHRCHFVPLVLKPAPSHPGFRRLEIFCFFLLFNYKSLFEQPLWQPMFKQAFVIENRAGNVAAGTPASKGGCTDHAASWSQRPHSKSLKLPSNLKKKWKGRKKILFKHTVQTSWHKWLEMEIVARQLLWSTFLEMKEGRGIASLRFILLYEAAKTPSDCHSLGSCSGLKCSPFLCLPHYLSSSVSHPQVSVCVCVLWMQWPSTKTQEESGSYSSCVTLSEYGSFLGSVSGFLASKPTSPELLLWVLEEAIYLHEPCISC